MKLRGVPYLFAVFLSPVSATGQQACPVNSNFSLGTLSHWGAYLGNNQFGNGPGAIMQTFDTAKGAPGGTLGVQSIHEFQSAYKTGIQVQTIPGKDTFGGFATIPKIGGYQYASSVKVGSTGNTALPGDVAMGGYVRGITYTFDVPVAQPFSPPYTVTFAYALVLENGSHEADQQPQMVATLSTKDSVITCASPSFFLPTSGNDVIRPLDTAKAYAEGFTLSKVPTPNIAKPVYDVWTKDWSEVTIDMSPYRGQVVTLTFETDNCVPGAHFAYSYIAIRNTCAGTVITGDSMACANINFSYSIPALPGAVYHWSVPADWTINSGADSNVLNVKAGAEPGFIIANAINACANLADTFKVNTAPATVAGSLDGDREVCTGSNVNLLQLVGSRGSILNWIASTDGGKSWSTISDTTTQYAAQNVDTTTIYKVLVQWGMLCPIDSSGAAKIQVDPLSAGGFLLPDSQSVCTGQTHGVTLSLKGKSGAVLNWQSSPDRVNWSDLSPIYTDSLYPILNVGASADYRVIVRSGVCPADTSSVAIINLLSARFPQGEVAPADTLICYGDKAPVNGLISVGTSYSWTNAGTLSGAGNGIIPATPFLLGPVASPLKTTQYILVILDKGCPYPLLDSVLVEVRPPILVNAGNDTAVVEGQPLQLNAGSNDPTVTYSWSPSTGLNNPDIPNPQATYPQGNDSIRYVVRALSATGCSGTASVLVKIFSTGPDIFVPNAFTPGAASNNIFRPSPVGISSLAYFRVYNRWGQLVFNTSTIGQGWDGRVNGHPEETGTYVWMVAGTTYTGKKINHKGTVMLIR